jgi:hypothetical protein
MPHSNPKAEHQFSANPSSAFTHALLTIFSFNFVVGMVEMACMV